MAVNILLVPQTLLHKYTSTYLKRSVCTDWEVRQSGTVSWLWVFLITATWSFLGGGLNAVWDVVWQMPLLLLGLIGSPPINSIPSPRTPAMLKLSFPSQSDDIHWLCLVEQTPVSSVILCVHGHRWYCGSSIHQF